MLDWGNSRRFIGDEHPVSADFRLQMRVDAQPLSGQSCNRLSTDAGMLDLESCPLKTRQLSYSDKSDVQGLIGDGISLLSQDVTSGNFKACAAPYKWLDTSSLGKPVNPSPSTGECNVRNKSFDSSRFYSGAVAMQAIRCIVVPVTQDPAEGRAVGGREGRDSEHALGPKSLCFELRRVHLAIWRRRRGPGVRIGRDGDAHVVPAGRCPVPRQSALDVLAGDRNL